MPDWVDWWRLSDEELLRQCEVDLYKSSGPGGQKKNKTSSAVRLRHQPTALVVTATESRSQHENRARALRRLRVALATDYRQEFAPFTPELALFEVGPKDSRYLPMVARLLDGLAFNQGQLSNLAEQVGVNSAKLVSFFKTKDEVWRSVQELRARFGRKPLR